MDFNKLTIKAQEAVAAAQELALRRRQPRAHARPPAARAPRPGAVRRLARLARRGGERSSLRCRACRAATQQPNVSAAFSRLLDRADDERRKLEDDYVSTEHLFLALEPVPREEILAWIEQVRGGQRVTSQDPEGSYQALEKFGRDLTEAAEAGKLDPVIGRDEEIRRVIQILSRRTKNNPVLIGEPGVGKTAIAEGLAQRIVARRRPGRAEGSPRLGARHRRAARRLEVPRRVRRAAQGGAHRDQERATGGSSSSSTSCTRSSARVRPRAPSTPRTCSSRCWRAASSAASARPRSTSTASTSRRTRRSSGASRPCSSASRRSPTRSRSCAA